MNTLSIRLPDEMMSKLNEVCQYYHRSKNYITVQALKGYMEDMLEDIEDSMDEDIAVRYNNPSKILLSSAEATEYLKANCKG